MVVHIFTTFQDAKLHSMASRHQQYGQTICGAEDGGSTYHTVWYDTTQKTVILTVTSFKLHNQTFCNLQHCTDVLC